MRFFRAKSQSRWKPASLRKQWVMSPNRITQASSLKCLLTNTLCSSLKIYIVATSIALSHPEVSTTSSRSTARTPWSPQPTSRSGSSHTSSVKTILPSKWLTSLLRPQGSKDLYLGLRRQRKVAPADQSPLLEQGAGKSLSRVARESKREVRATSQDYQSFLEGRVLVQSAISKGALKRNQRHSLDQ